MPVVGVHLDGLEDELIGGGGEGAVEVGAGDGVPEVAVYGVDEEEFAVFVPVESPGVGGAVAEDFEGFAGGVEAPDAALDGDAHFFGGAGGADESGAGSAAASVEPAVGTPAEAVGEVMVVAVGDGEAIEDDLGLGVGDVVLVGIGDEEELGRAHEVDAIFCELDGGEHLEVIGEDLAGVGLAVVVGIVEDDEAVAEGEVESFSFFGVGEVFGNPHAAFVIPGHGDGVLDLGLGGEDGGLEVLGDLERGGGFFCRRRVGGFVLLAVVGGGKLISLRAAEAGEYEE